MSRLSYTCIRFTNLIFIDFSALITFAEDILTHIQAQIVEKDLARVRARL